MKNDCRKAKLDFQVTFSLPSTSCLLKLPSFDSAHVAPSLVYDMASLLLDDCSRPFSSVVSLFTLTTFVSVVHSRHGKFMHMVDIGFN